MDLEHCAAIPGGIQQCPKMAVGTFRHKGADSTLRDYPYCQKHLDARIERAGREGREKARKKSLRAFVYQWRESHPDDLYDPPWICPLCGGAVNQLAMTSVPGSTARWHQLDHGQDWRDYQALAETAEAPPAASNS